MFAKGEDDILIFLRVGPVIADALAAVGRLRQSFFGTGGKALPSLSKSGFLSFLYSFRPDVAA